MMKPSSNASNQSEGSAKKKKEFLTPSSRHENEQQTLALHTPKSSSSISSSSTLFKSRAMMLSTVIAIVVFHVLGILFGYILFYSAYRTECAIRINNIKNETNHAMNRMIQEAKATSIEQQVNLNDALTIQQKECNALQHDQNDKLVTLKQQEEERTRINMKYHECIQSNIILNDQVQQLHNKVLQNQLQTHSLTEEYNTVLQQITKYEQHIVQINSKSDQQIMNIESQLQLTKTMIQDKIHEVEQLKLQIENNHTVSSSTSNNKKRQSNNPSIYTKEMIQMQGDIRRQQYAMLIHSFGQPPYHVLLELRVSSNMIKDDKAGATITLELVIDNINDTPHAIFTFLTTIQRMLYHDTTLSLTQELYSSSKAWWSQNSNSNIPPTNETTTVFVGGHPSTCTKKQKQSKLKRLYAEYGYNIEHLLYFIEHSNNVKQSTCTKGSIGFKDYGPNIEIYNSVATDEKNTKTTCFGRIRNYEDLLSQHTDKSKSINMDLTIVNTKIVVATGKTSTSEINAACNQ